MLASKSQRSSNFRNESSFRSSNQFLTTTVEMFWEFISAEKILNSTRLGIERTGRFLCPEWSLQLAFLSSNEQDGIEEYT